MTILLVDVNISFYFVTLLDLIIKGPYDSVDPEF